MAIILFPKKNYKKQGQMFFRNYSLALHMGVATNSELGGGGGSNWDLFCIVSKKTV